MSKLKWEVKLDMPHTILKDNRVLRIFTERNCSPSLKHLGMSLYESQTLQVLKNDQWIDLGKNGFHCNDLFEPLSVAKRLKLENEMKDYAEYLYQDYIPS